MDDSILNGLTVVCGCCGDVIPDTPDYNAFSGQYPNPCDEGFGMCMGCLDYAEEIVFRNNRLLPMEVS